MTPNEALKILDAMTGRAHGTRDEHMVVANALQTLLAAITPTPEATEKPAEGPALVP